ncbi:MAG: hypothetical protein V4757_02310 [Pseudomonadota bacterium]
MTTPSTKPVHRETSAFVRDGSKLKPLIATIHGSLLILRPKGTRRPEVIDLGAVWQGAVKNRVALERAERKALRRSRR